MKSQTIILRITRRGAVCLRRFTRDNGTGFYQLDYTSAKGRVNITDYPVYSAEFDVITYNRPEAIPTWVDRLVCRSGGRAQ